MTTPIPDKPGAGTSAQSRWPQVKRWMRPAGTVVCVTSLIIIGKNYLHELERLRYVYLSTLVCMLLLAVGTHVVAARLVQASLQPLGHHLRLWRVFLLNALISQTNLLLPRAGWGARAAYLKLRHGVALADSSSLLLPVVVLQVACTGLLGLTGQAVLWVVYGQPWNLVASAMFVVALGGGTAAVVMRIPPPLIRRLPKVLRRFAHRLNRAWRTLGASPAFIAHMLLLQLAMILLRTARLGLAFYAVGAEFNPVGLLVVSLLADLAVMLSFTPAGLGFREAAVTYGGQLMAVDPAVALSAAVLDRLVVTAVVIVLAQVAIWRLDAS